jgi:hypothetical protein
MSGGKMPSHRPISAGNRANFSGLSENDESTAFADKVRALINQGVDDHIRVMIM